MATVKPEPWALKLPPNGYDHPLDIHISEGSDEAKALRQLWRRQTQATHLTKKIKEIIPKLPTEPQHTSTTITIDLPSLRLAYGFNADDLDFTWKWLPGIDTSTKPPSLHEQLTTHYHDLADTLALACNISNQLDTRLRDRLSIPTECDTYAVQTVYGVKGWLILRTPERTTELEYITFP